MTTLEPGGKPSKDAHVTQDQFEEKAQTYYEYEYHIHRHGIGLWSLLMGIFFTLMLSLDLLGYIHNDGANPATYRLWCLGVMTLCTFMCIQNSRGRAAQVRRGFLAFGMLQFWGYSVFLFDSLGGRSRNLPSIFLTGDVLMNLCGTTPVLALGMTGMPLSMLVTFISMHVMAAAAAQHYLADMRWPLALMRSALAHAVCNGAFLAVKRKSMAAHAAYLAGRSGLAGAATPQGQPRPTGAALAGGRGASGSQGSGSGLAGLPTIQEVTAASKAGAAAPRQVLEKEPQVVTSTGAGAAQAAGVLQRGGPGAQELVQAAGAESQGACVGLMQPEKESAEPGSPPGWGCRPAAASVGRKWHAAATAPLLCRRRIPKYISRSTTQFQVHLKVYGKAHAQDLSAGAAGELEALMRQSVSGQPRTRPAIRSGCILLSFTWCCGLPAGLEQLPPLRSMAPRPGIQVLQSIKDMVPRWIGGTCLTRLIEHGAEVTLQVDGLLARYTWDAHASSWTVDASCTPQPVASLPAPGNPLLTSSTPISSSGQAVHFGITLLPAPVLLLPPTSYALEQQQQQQQLTLQSACTDSNSQELLDIVKPQIHGSPSTCEAGKGATTAELAAVAAAAGVGEAAVPVHISAVVHGLGGDALDGWQETGGIPKAAGAAAAAAAAAEAAGSLGAARCAESTAPQPGSCTAPVAASKVEACEEQGQTAGFQLVARVGMHFVPVDVLVGAKAAGASGEGGEGGGGAAVCGEQQPRCVQAAVLLPSSLACTDTPLLMHLDLWRSGICLASSAVVLLPHHLEAVALELRALADSKVVAKEPEAGAVTEEGAGMVATRACKGGAEDVRAAPPAGSASLDEAIAAVRGHASTSVWQEGQQDRQGMGLQQAYQQLPEQESAQSFMQDLMQDLVDFAEFCKQQRHCTSSQAAMMEAIGGDLMDYAHVSHMPALCQYLEQLSAHSAADILPLVRPSCVEADMLPAPDSSLKQQLPPPKPPSKQQKQQQGERVCWGNSCGRSSTEETDLMANTSNGEASSYAG